MRYLLDTNILSELRRPQPDKNVLNWLMQLDEDQTFLSVISLAEIRRGIALMDEGRKRDALTDWLATDLPQRFDGRVLPINEKIASAWGDLMAMSKHRGIGLAPMDAMLGATVVAYDLVLATRNVKDFKELGLSLIDPWQVATEDQQPLDRLKGSVLRYEGVTDPVPDDDWDGLKPE
jgi:toxin FitB